METISRWLLTFLLNSLWQIPVVMLVALVATRLARNGPAAHRHAVWVAALAAAIALPVTSVRSGEQSATLQLRVREAAPVAATSAIVRATPGPAPSAARIPARRSVSFAGATAVVLLAVYFSFLLASAVRFLRAWSRIVTIRRQTAVRPVPLLVEDVWEHCKEAFHLSRVELRSSASLSSPVTAGIGRAAIVLPECLFADTSEAVLTTAIGHEMAHVARHDFAWNLFYELLYLPVSFHPACWLIHREIERTREMACDELVTQRLLDSTTYARSIMNIAATMTREARPSYGLGVFDGDILEERIRRLMDRPVTSLKRARLLLVAGLSALALCVVIASSLAISAHAQSPANGEMKLAGEQYNMGNFKGAVEHFESAVRLDPANINARFFLANALLREFSSEEGAGPQLLERARAQYFDVLGHEPGNKLAMEGLISVDLETKQWNEAQDLAKRLIQVDPADKNGYYSAGVVDWAMVFPEFQRAREAAGVKPNEYAIPDAEVRRNLRARFGLQIDDGIRMLERALEIDPNYSDAMAYVNLLDRLKAGMAESASESTELIAEADRWVGKALAAKRRAGPKQAGSDRLDVNGPPPGPGSAERGFATAPPPPPPPPAPGMRAGMEKLPVSDSPPESQRNLAERTGLFWQVAGGEGVAARELVGTLKRIGLHPVVIYMEGRTAVRVMVGPYQGADLDKARADLEKAGLRAIRTW